MGQLGKEKAAIPKWMAEWRAQRMCMVAEERGRNAGVVGGMEKHVVKTQAKLAVLRGSPLRIDFLIFYIANYHNKCTLFGPLPKPIFERPLNAARAHCEEGSVSGADSAQRCAGSL